MAQVKNLSSWIVARNVFTAVAADPQAGKARREVKMKTQENKQHGKDYQNEEAEKKGGQKFEKDENEEILYFVISLSKLVKF